MACYNSTTTSCNGLSNNSSNNNIDENGYTQLCHILTTYNAPITEDYAWALTYLSTRCLDSLSTSPNSHYTVSQISDTGLIQLHQDGHVSLNITLCNTENTDAVNYSQQHRLKELTQPQIISKIAVIIYKALDFGMRENEERSLSSELETLLSQMVCADEHVVGYLTNRSSVGSVDAHLIIESCTRHLNTVGIHYSSFDCVCNYYQQMCKNLMQDFKEFSKLLDVATQASKQLASFHANQRPFQETRRPPENFTALAKMWVHVVRELRKGVQLRHPDSAIIGQPQQYEKTPFERLMDDIKSQRYCLRNIPVDQLQKSHMRKDVHDIIMEYIRSRPTLRKVSDRVLGPPLPKLIDPVEELMKSIRQVHHLRPVRKLEDFRNGVNSCR